jgi:ubiquinone/menaquinone biosynthesis C-methylase UbiE
METLVAPTPPTAAESAPRWHHIWIKKGAGKAGAPITLLDAIALDGFDTGGGKMTEAMWLELHALADRKLAVQPGETLLEVGSGSGAFLYPFAQKGARVSGIDYSPPLVEIARRFLPQGEFVHGEASRLPYADASFDKVASMGVFLYFPGWAYAEQALDEMLRVLRPGGRAFVIDINDHAKMTLAEDIRRRNLGAAKYDELYRELRQTYYERAWFRRFAEQRGLRHELTDQNLAHYESGQWRFNFYFEKP